jgi:hypothetical protein
MIINLLSGVTPSDMKRIIKANHQGNCTIKKTTEVEQKRSDHDKISDYVYISDRPFTAKILMAETGLKKSSVYRWLKQMEAQGDICKVEVKGNATFFTRETRNEVKEKKQQISILTPIESKFVYLFGVGFTLAILAQCSLVIT